MVLRTASIAFLGLAVLPSAARASCSCVGVTPAQRLAQSAAVFVGRVVAAHPAPRRLEDLRADRVDRLVVRDAIKGPGNGDTVTVVSEGAFCGVEFALGEEYLVYAARVRPGTPTGPAGGRTGATAAAPGDSLFTGYSSATRPRCHATADLRALRAPRRTRRGCPPQPAVVPTPRPPRGGHGPPPNVALQLPSPRAGYRSTDWRSQLGWGVRRPPSYQ